MFLLDTNVLFATLHQAHVHHQAANAWLSTTDRYATCALTQIGVFRLLLMSAPMHGSPLSTADANAVLADFSSAKEHLFIACPAISPEFVGKTQGHKAAFDDYLVQVAYGSRHTLATFDRALTNRWPEHTVLIPQEQI